MLVPKKTPEQNKKASRLAQKIETPNNLKSMYFYLR